ncbi:MAG: NAD(P) transhydrogenase subunit alpha [Bacteroidota bacterium]
MIISILKEINDTRVVMIPVQIKNLSEQNHELWVESGAGNSSFFSDKDYEEAGAKVKSRDEILSGAEMILTINPLPVEEVNKISSGTTYISELQPFFEPSVLNAPAEKGLLTFSLDMIPRTTLAQAMDVISSMASIAGYKAVLQAANLLSKYFPMLTTAAGSNPPAKVLILGAGVAGLQAIATAKRLGAVVEVFDTRAASKEEVQSLGAKFVEVEGSTDDLAAGGYAVEQTDEYKEKQKALIHEKIVKSDVVITTALLRGKKAPILVTTEMLEEMQPGSVVIDIASATGGNCEKTVDNEVVEYSGVKILGNSKLAAELPTHASKLYSKNVENYILPMFKEGEFAPDFEDEIIGKSCMTRDGQVLYNA